MCSSTELPSCCAHSSLSMLAGALNLQPLFLRISTLLPRSRILGSSQLQDPPRTRVPEGIGPAFRLPLAPVRGSVATYAAWIRYETLRLATPAGTREILPAGQPLGPGLSNKLSAVSNGVEVVRPLRGGVELSSGEGDGLQVRVL
jgi:hypothetical protein